jgi:hypothetical protein
VREARLLFLLPFVSGALHAQAAVSTDLWRVAAGTVAVPLALADDGLAPLWTPAVLLRPGGPRARAGVESLHAPEEIGVSGALAALTVRGAGGSLAFAYGRIGLEDLLRTETSPEAVGGLIPAYVHLVSLGYARAVGPHTAVGVAARFLEGRLADLTDRRMSLDAGVLFTGVPGARLGLATRFFDPRFAAGEPGASYAAGAEYATPPLGPGTLAPRLRARYGLTLQRGDGPAHHLSAGVAAGRVLALDLGAARESLAGEGLWRSRAQLVLGTGRYLVGVGRDGGTNGFGATYRFSLTVEFR